MSLLPDRKRDQVCLFKRSKVAGCCVSSLLTVEVASQSESVSLCEETGVSFNTAAQFHPQVRGQK